MLNDKDGVAADLRLVCGPRDNGLAAGEAERACRFFRPEADDGQPGHREEEAERWDGLA